MLQKIADESLTMKEGVRVDTARDKKDEPDQRRHNKKVKAKS